MQYVQPVTILALGMPIPAIALGQLMDSRITQSPPLGSTGASGGARPGQSLKAGSPVSGHPPPFVGPGSVTAHAANPAADHADPSGGSVALGTDPHMTQSWPSESVDPGPVVSALLLGRRDCVCVPRQECASHAGRSHHQIDPRTPGKTTPTTDPPQVIELTASYVEQMIEWRPSSSSSSSSSSRILTGPPCGLGHVCCGGLDKDFFHSQPTCGRRNVLDPDVGFKTHVHGDADFGNTTCIALFLI